ncbi:MAG: ABC transporter substrate-binding protein [Gemmatimonadota bacterium]|jgi:iron(III) transport system substrate-binding protein
MRVTRWRAGGAPVRLLWGTLATTTLAAACTDARPVLLVHSPLQVRGLEWMEERFEADWPNVDLRWIQVPPEETLRLLREGPAEEWPDVWWGAPSWVLARAAGEGRLAAASPSWLDDAGVDVRDPARRWIGVLLDPLVIAFNRDTVSLGQAPRDWIDLLHPRWAGEVVVPDAPGSVAGSVLVGAVVGRDVAKGRDGTGGLDWLRRLDATVAAYPADEGTVVQRLVRGQETLAVLRLSTAVQAAEDDGRLAWRLAGSGAPVVLEGVALVAGTTAASEAEELVEWLGSPDVVGSVASRFHRLPALPGGDDAATPAALARARLDLRAWMTDADTLAAHLDEWIDRWRAEVREATPRVF